MPRVANRAALAALALVAVLSLVACGGGAAAASPVLHLASWTFEGPRGAHPVELPTRFDDDLPHARAHYALHTTATLPPAMRGQPLTFAITYFPALVKLRANGRDAIPLDTGPFDRYRSSGADRWRIPAEQTGGDALDLELDVEHTWTESAWMSVVPTLSATPGGDPFFLFVSAFERVSTIGGFVATLVVSLIYGLLFSLDRRRPIHLWHAVQGIAGSLYPAFFLGALQPIVGTADVPIIAIALTGASVGSLHFVAEAFDRPPPSRAWWLLVVAAVVVALARSGPFDATLALAPVVIAAILSAVVQALATLASRLRRGRASLVEWVAGLGFPMIFLFGIPDTASLTGMGAPLGGLHGGCFVIGLVSLLHAAALSRTHSQSLHRADELNVQLAARVELLEASNREIGTLNHELRRQIAARSERLADALARLGPMHTPPRAFAPGDVIDGRYDVLRRVGEGGMGVVYEIARAADGRRLALKILQAPRNGAELARLAREAELASRVDHPNVVRIVDVDVAPSGALYVVMEYVEGASLDALRARYRDEAWARRVLAQVASGLAALHAQGIVHRDLKPGNVLVTADAVAKIADFGIATRSTADATTRPRDEDRSLTRTGQILGTPAYMAPELMRGAKLATPASDVYSFGVIAWEVLTGELPAGFEVLLHLRSRDGVQLPSIATLLPALPPGLAPILDACLARDAAARPTAEALAAALDQSLAGSSTSMRAPPA
jgi:serine/threonine-protein kinase